MEFLKEVIGDELYGKLTEALKGKEKEIELINARDGSYIPKGKFNEINDSNKSLKDQLKERDDQLKALKGDSLTTVELKQKIEDLETANKEATKVHDLAVKTLQKDYAVKDALREAKDPRTVLPLLEMEKVTLGADGKLIGIDEQLAVIKKEKAWLFNDKVTPTGGANPPDGGPVDLKDRYKKAIEAHNTALAIQIKQQAYSEGIEIL